MRHRKATIKLNRTSSHRTAMFRNMATSLFKYERIRTTDPKAKELRRWVDNLITLAKRGDLHARRQALSIVREKSIVHKLFEEASTRYGNMNGGYTRVIKLGRRHGDGALMSLVELVSSEKDTKKPVRKRKAVRSDEEKPSSKKSEKAKDKIDRNASGTKSERDTDDAETAGEDQIQPDTTDDSVDDSIDGSEDEASADKSEIDTSEKPKDPTDSESK